MRIDNRDLIQNHYLQIWEDWLIIQFMDLTGQERAEVIRMYREEVDPVYPDNPGCSRCIIEVFRVLINKFREN